jgi:multicomponent Na+:H+ antiporter subunit G
MTDVLYYVAGSVLVVGAMFAFIAAIGVLRLPDLYTRMHAASKAGAVGAGLMFAAVALVSVDLPVILRAILGFLFILLTTPISAHLLARAAYLAGVAPTGLTVVNDLEAHKASKRQ